MPSNEEIFALACEALKKMLSENGPGFTFPFDLIWQNTPPGVDVPSLSRPHQVRRLLAQGFLEKTGAMTRAVSDKRAGSATPEYRFGPTLAPKRASPPSRTPEAGYAAQLTHMQAAFDIEGYVISAAELGNFFLAMMVSPLVILSGISGTGKSMLPRKFAQYTGAGFHAVPVQPQWSDNSDLFGYVSTLAPDKYVEGHLIRGLSDAHADRSKLVITLLDEMNLAPVEHYFSDFLSVAETRRRDGSAIRTDPLPLELPRLVPGGEDEYARLRGISLPHNLRIVGTANMDETTKTFSPKVLDRAFTIEFDDPDITAFAAGATEPGGVRRAFPTLAAAIVKEENPINVREARAKSQPLFDYVSAMLKEVDDILAPAGIKFGYRTRDAILLYLHFWRELALEEVISGNAAFDFCLLQKVLPKISGTGDALSTALGELSDWLRRGDRAPFVEGGLSLTGPFARSLQKVERMRALLDTDGSTHYWGV